MFSIVFQVELEPTLHITNADMIIAVEKRLESFYFSERSKEIPEKD